MLDFAGSPPEHVDQLAAYNDTELYQTARTAGLPVEPATPRQEVVAMLLGEIGYVVDTPHPIDSWRRGLMSLVLDYWSKLSNQMACPAQELAPYAKEKKPKIPETIACFRCTDQRVIACVVDNKSREQLISIRRKDR